MPPRHFSHADIYEVFHTYHFPLICVAIFAATFARRHAATLFRYLPFASAMSPSLLRFFFAGLHTSYAAPHTIFFATTI